MEIYSVYSTEFAKYGTIISGISGAEVMETMQTIPLPAEGINYRPSIPELERLPIFQPLSNNAFGGMPTQIGMCWGRNTKLNCLEYHRDSEFNLGADDFILLLAQREDIENGMLDTAKVKAFRVPAGVLIEVYATTLHYAPCHTDPAKGFRVMVGLPYGTNETCPKIQVQNDEDKLLWGRNKWLLAHPDSDEARQGAAIRLIGSNIDITAEI